MKPVKGKIISIAALVYVFLSVAALLAAVPVQASEVMKNSAEKIYIEGAASVDGGEWTQTVPDRMTDDRFHRAVFRGRLSQPLEDGNRLVIVSTNVWYRLEANGFTASNERPSDTSSMKDTPGTCI